MIDHRFFNALRIIVSKLKNTDTNWALGGSLNLALQGVDISPGDIDILTDRQGAYRIGKLLKDFEIKKIELTKSERFSSHLGKFSIEGLEVEVIGNLRVKTSEGRWIRLHKPEQKAVLKLEDLVIPVSPLEEEIRAYEIFGRTRTVEKIREAISKRI